MIDQVFNNRYRVVRILGSGVSGLIYLAADTRHPDCPVCVIRQLKLPTKNPQALRSLQFLLTHKSETLERLAQTNQNPELLNYFVENKKFYLVEEYIPDHPLTTLKKSGQQPKDDQGLIRFQEMLTLAGKPPEPEVESPLVSTSTQTSIADSGNWEIFPEKPVPKPTNQSRRKRWHWLILAGGISLAIGIGLIGLLRQNPDRA
ncbi:MAG: serine/threonine-protein kinase, partial [Coleofasciculus sp. C2-GNP5-27]